MCRVCLSRSPPVFSEGVFSPRFLLRPDRHLLITERLKSAGFEWSLMDGFEHLLFMAQGGGCRGGVGTHRYLPHSGSTHHITPLSASEIHLSCSRRKASPRFMVTLGIHSPFS